MAQFARPDADLTTNNWTTTPLWSKVNEGEPGDGTTIISDATTPQYCDVRLSDVTDPGVSTEHILRVRWRRVGGTAIDVRIRLLETGVAIRATKVHTTLGTSFVTDEFTLSEAQADSIGDYTNLSIRLEGYNVVGSAQLEVDFCELQVPNVPAGGTQFARPASDVAAGAWTTTPLWSKIDEGAPGDDVTIASADNSNGDNAEFTTTDVTDPEVSTGHILRAKWAKSASGGHAINGTLELWQGSAAAGTKVAEFTVSALSEVFQTDTYTLSAAEADAITNYADLNLQVLRTGDVGGPAGNRRSLVVDFAELEVPGAVVSDDLLADDLQTLSQLSQPAIGQEHAITADDLETAAQLSTPAIGQEHALAADDFDVASEVTQPAIAVQSPLLADDLESAAELTSPAIGQEHAITADDAQSAAEITSPAIGQEHGLAADDLDSAAELTSPALTESNLLTADDLDSTTEITSPVIAQEHGLSADDLETAAEFTSPAVGQEHALAGDDLETASELTSPVLTESGATTDELTADDLETATTYTSPAIGQEHALSASSLDSTAEVGSPAIGEPVAPAPVLGPEWTATGIGAVAESDESSESRRLREEVPREELVRRAVRRALDTVEGIAPAPDTPQEAATEPREAPSRARPPRAVQQRLVAQARSDAARAGLDVTFREIRAELERQLAELDHMERFMIEEQDLEVILMLA